MQETILSFIEKYNKANMKKLKYQLKTACVGEYKKHGGRKGMAQKLGMNENFFSSCINPSQSGIITFENLIKICNTFNFDLNKILDQDVEVTKSTRGRKKRWDEDKIKNYIQTYKIQGIDAVMQEYNLTKKTAMFYYQKFISE